MSEGFYKVHPRHRVRQFNQMEADTVDWLQGNKRWQFTGLQNLQNPLFNPLENPIFSSGEVHWEGEDGCFQGFTGFT